MRIAATQPLTVIDGRSLYYAFIAGGNRVIASQAELNRINVFPVNDGDTGTNLATTVTRNYICTVFGNLGCTENGNNDVHINRLKIH